MEGPDVVELQVYFHERFPVEWIFHHVHAVEHVILEVVVVCETEVGEIAQRIARAREQQSIPGFERSARQIEARIVGKLGCTEQLAPQVVSPAMHGADQILRVAVSLEDDGLTMAAHVR